MTLPAHFPTAEARQNAIRRMQRFLNTRQDMFHLPASLTLTGMLDEPTVQALNQASQATIGWGTKMIPPGTVDEAGLVAFDERLEQGNYSYDLGRLLPRYFDADTGMEKAQWWRSVQCLLAHKGAAFEDHIPASREAVANALAAQIAKEKDTNLLGWLGSEGASLPAPLPAKLTPVLKEIPGKRNASALYGRMHIPAAGFGLPTDISYNFAPPQKGDAEYARAKTPEMLSPAGQALFTELLRETELVSNVKFTRVKLPLKAQMQIYVDDALAHSESPNWKGKVPARPLGGPVYVMFDAVVGQKLPDMNDARRVHLHEIGHVLSENHPHSPITNDANRLSKAMDNINHSVMSYFYLPAQPLPDGPMALDIIVQQKQYGAPKLVPTARLYRVAENAAVPVRRTLVDTDAELDWLDASDSKRAVHLDLRNKLPSHSRIGQHRIWIAPGSRIEGAIGGQGNDILIASKGAQYLIGGAGVDQFVLTERGHVRILDMEAQDVLHLGKNLLGSGATYAEQPWGLDVTLKGSAGKSQLDIVTEDKYAVLKQLKNLLPDLQTQVMAWPKADPRMGIMEPVELSELAGNQLPKVTKLPAGTSVLKHAAGKALQK